MKEKNNKSKLTDEKALQILQEYAKTLKLTINEVKLNTDITDIKLLGRKIEEVNIDGEIKKIKKYVFLVEKEMDDIKEKGKRVTRKEYYEDADLIAIIDEEYGLIPEKNHIGEDLSKLLPINKNAKSLVQLENERINKLAKVLNKKPEEIKAMAQIDNKPIISPEAINSKTELNLNEKITQTESFKDIVPGVKKYTKVIVTYSENVQGGTGRFSFVGIDKDGNAEVIDSLIPTQGTNPTNELITINRNGDDVEKEQVSSMYRVNGRQDEGFAFKLDEYGIPKVSYVRGLNSKEYLAGEVQTRNLKPTTLQVKNMMDKTKNTYVNDEVGKAKQEINKHGKAHINNIDDIETNDIKHDDDKEEIDV